MNSNVPAIARPVHRGKARTWNPLDPSTRRAPFNVGMLASANVPLAETSLHADVTKRLGELAPQTARNPGATDIRIQSTPTSR